MFVDTERHKQKYKIFLFFFTDLYLIISRFTEKHFVSAGLFQYKAAEEVGCIFDFLPAGMYEKNTVDSKLPLFFNCFGKMNLLLSGV